MEGSEHQGMQLPIFGLMRKWICSKLALGSGIVFPDPVVGNPDPFIEAALLSLAGSHFCSRCWRTFPSLFSFKAFLYGLLPLQGPVSNPSKTVASSTPMGSDDLNRQIYGLVLSHTIIRGNAREHRTRGNVGSTGKGSTGKGSLGRRSTGKGRF
jgi:hypothetical protein